MDIQGKNMKWKGSGGFAGAFLVVEKRSYEFLVMNTLTSVRFSGQ